MLLLIGIVLSKFYYENLSMRIALVFICKNNEGTIGSMIESCLPIVDEICATDTGSSDRTKEIIASFSNRLQVHIYDEPWKNFAQARTAMMANAKVCKCDYYLIMDTDELLEIGENFEKEKLTEDGYLIHTLSGGLSYYRERLVKSTFEWIWKGYAHEYMVSPPGMRSYARLKGLTMNVPGKSVPFSRNIIRNYKLLLEDYKDNPDNSRTIFYLAETCRDLRWLDDAIIYYTLRLKMGGYQEEIYYSMLQLGIIYSWLSDFEKAKEWLYKAIEKNTNRTEAMYNLALLLQKENRHDLATMYLDRIVKTPPSDDVLFISKNIADYEAEFQLSISCFYSGEYDRALDIGLKLNKRSDLPINIRQQNQKNIVFFRRKWNEIHPDKKEYVLETPTPAWDGLGDHLFISAIPKILKEKMGFKKVWMSNNMKFKTPGVKHVVWENNPYVDGFVDELGMIDDYRQQVHDMMRAALNSKHKTVVNRVMELYIGTTEGNEAGLPWVDVLQFFPLNTDLMGKVVFDGHWKSFSGLDEEFVLKFFEKFGFPDYQIRFVEEQKADHPAAELHRITLPNVPFITVNDLQDYGRTIGSCKEFVCMMSGGAVLAAAMRCRAHVLDSALTRSDIFRFNEYNEVHILDRFLPCERKTLWIHKTAGEQ